MSFFVRSDDGRYVNLDHASRLFIEDDRVILADVAGIVVVLWECDDHYEAVTRLNEIAARANAGPGSAPVTTATRVPRPHFGEPTRRTDR